MVLNGFLPSERVNGSVDEEQLLVGVEDDTHFEDEDNRQTGDFTADEVDEQNEMESGKESS